GAARVAADEIPPARIEWSDVLRLARESSPRLALDRESVALAQADRRMAAALPNPSLSYSYDKPGHGSATMFDGERQQDFGLELPLPKPGLRGARIGAADRALEAARSGVGASTNARIADAGAAFIGLLAGQQQAELLATGQRELQHLRDVV